MCDIGTRRDISLGRNNFLSDIRNKPPEIWKMSIYASPKQMRRRNVYDKNHSFWKLIDVEPKKPDLNFMQNIDSLQKKVSIFGSSTSVIEIPTPKRVPRRQLPVAQRSEKIGSLCSEHNWSCVKRPTRLGFLKHDPDERKEIGLVSKWSDLCLEPCCMELNSRLYYCIQECCWLKDKKEQDGFCDQHCCKDYKVKLYQNEPYKLIEDETEPVLGFIRHGHGLRLQAKRLEPIETAYDLCVDSCCLLDNMNIFNAESWFTLTKLGLRPQHL